MSTVIVTNLPEIIEFLDQVVDLDYSGDEYDDYWCININPFQCGGCGSVVAYAQCGNHFIIIWREKDEDSILELASALKDSDDDYDPRIVQYNRILGPCVEFQDAVKHGWISEITH